MGLIKKINNNYFLSSFFWSTLSKVFNAILGFVSVPLLIGYYGKADYGLLSIATACNGYMQLMDLGMNTGAVKFFSQWEAEGKRELIHRVSRTNETFYLIISVINILGLLAIAIWGENLFAITHEQFIQLKYCFFILALFSCISWLTTVYTQLLIAYKQLAFTMKMQTVMVLLKGLLLGSVFIFGLSLTEYFFYLTFFVSLLIIPYIIKCKINGIMDTLKPAAYWSDFKVVFNFSLAMFALSLFQVTATQSRPIILSIFAYKGAESVADYRIVEVIPQFIITVCGTFTAIFLPKSSEMMIKSTNNEIQQYIVNWTSKTTTLVCTLCIPFILGAKSILSAYVGDSYEYLIIWLQIWCFFLIVQMHSTPAFSFVLANGKTKVLVITTAIACVISMLINAILCKVYPVGSAVLGYAVYMLCLIGVYYGYLYKKYLHLRRITIFKSFFKPFILAIFCGVAVYLIPFDIIDSSIINIRVLNLIRFAIRTCTWMGLYFSMLLLFKVFNLSEFKNMNK